MNSVTENLGIDRSMIDTFEKFADGGQLRLRLEARAEETNRTAREIMEFEVRAREAKTERLRQARRARDNANLPTER